MTVTPTPTAPRLATAFDTGASNSDGVTNINTPTIVGTAAPGALVKLYDTNGALLGMATADATSGGYAISIVNLPSSDGLPDSNLDDGVHQVTVTATLPGEDTSQVSPPLLLTIDTQVPDAPTAPTLTAGSDTGASALDGITSMTTLTLTGQSEPGAQVQVLDGTTLVGQVTAASDGSYTVTTGVLDAKAHSFTAIAMDLAGNLSAPSNVTAVTIDTVAPAAPPAPTLAPGSDTGTLRTDGMTSDTTPVVVGTAEAGATVKLTDADGTVLGTAVAGSDGSYAIQSSTLLFGPNELKVTATDVAGNVSATSAPLNIVVQTQESTAMITASTDDDASAGSTTFTITFAEPIADRRGITPDDFKLVTTGTAFGTIESVSGFKLVTTGTAFGTIESVSGQTGTIVVDGLGGSGTVSVVLADDTQITDVAGKPIDLTSTQSHDVDGTVGGDVLPVSAGPSGVVGPGQDPSPSVGGRFVAFDSAFNNASGSTDVYVKDLVTGGLTKVTASLDGDPATRFLFPSLSGSGSVITFVSLTETNVSGQPVTFAANVYVATLTPADPDSGDSVVVGPITLVSTGNGNAGSSTTYQGDNDSTADAAVVSGDGSTVAFTSDQALLPGVTAGVKNVYAYDVATGTLTLVTAGTGMDEYGDVTSTIPDPYFGGFYQAFEPIANRPAGAGGDFASGVTSISGDGTKIAFISTATDLGGGPLPAEYLGVDGGPPLRAYVYDLTTGTKTVLDGTGAFGGLNASYQTFDPQISADGTTVTYDVQYESNSLVVFERNLVSGMVTQLTPGPTAGGYGEEDSGATPSGDGSYVAYSRNSLGMIGTEDPNQIIVSTPANAANGSGDLQGYQPTLTASGSAVVFTGLLGNDTVAYEATLGVTAGIGAVGTEDEIGAVGLAAIKAAGSITFTGTTNAPVGSLVSLQVGAQGGMPGLVTTGDVTAPGMWTVVANAADLGADGTYIVAVTVKGANGASPRATRDFQLDTVAPDAPVAPKLDPGSDTGLAHDGTVTDSDTPTLTGTAEAGATVTLIDQGGRTPGMVLGTGMADGNGVYAITASALTQGAHALAVTATDEAGNVSAASEALALNVDAIVPDAPQAPQEVTISTPGAVGDPPKLSNVAVANPDGDGVITTETAPVLSGRGVPGATVTLYDTDGVSVLGTAVVGADATWSITSSTLTDGLHKLTVTQTKASGAVSVASAPLDLTVDTLPPLSPVITTLGGPIDSNAEHTSQVDVNGTAEPGSTVQLHIDMDDMVSGTATVESDGTYEIDAMVAPGTHKLTVIATDAAGNASQPSAVTLVTVDTPAATAPDGTPITGKVTDGYIADAQVFATDGSGRVLPGTAIARTGLDGSFTLYGAQGAELEQSSGYDTSTGLELPGPLFAPASPAGQGDVAITPLTTFLQAYMTASGLGLAAATDAAGVALGLGTGVPLSTLDPVFQAPVQHNGSSSPQFEVVNAQLADTAVLIARVLGTQPGFATITNVQRLGFEATFTAIAQAAVAGTPANFTSASYVSMILSAAGALVNPSGVLAPAVLAAASAVIVAGNTALGALETLPQASLSQVLPDAAAIEYVEQFGAANALSFNDPATLPLAVSDYTGTGLTAALAAAETSTALGAPTLVPADDTGVSNHDGITDDLTPTFTGTALPGTVVELVDEAGSYFGYNSQGTIVGVGTADASGHYTITTTDLSLNSGPDYPNGRVSGAFIVAEPASAVSGATLGQVVGAPSYTTVPSTVLFLQLVNPQYTYDFTINGAVDASAPGDDATDSALQVYGSIAFESQNSNHFVVSIYADGGTIPIGTTTVEEETAVAEDFVLDTAPLSAGVHTLTAVATLVSGATETSAPFSVTVAPLPLQPGLAEGTGGLVGSTVFYYAPNELVTVPSGAPVDNQDSDPASRTAAGGAYTLPSPVKPADVIGVYGGIDALTGLPLGGNTPELTNDDPIYYGQSTPTLLAPSSASVVDALTSLVVATAPDYAAIYAANGTTNQALQTASSEQRVIAGLGLGNYDLLNTDPLALVQSGDPTLFLLEAKLLDTVTLLSPLDGFDFTALGNYIAQHAQAAIGSQNGYGFQGLLNLSDPASVLQMLQDSISYTSHIPTSVLQAYATVVAASNAAIDAAAQAPGASTAAGTPGLLATVVAIEKVAQTTEAALLASTQDDITHIVTNEGYGQITATQAAAQIAPLLPPEIAAFTGMALTSLITAEEAQAPQVTSFTSTTQGSTNAQRVDFVITFSQAVTGLTAASFTVNDGGGLIDTSILGVAAVAGSNGTQWDVTVGTGAGNGQLSLSYSNAGLLNATSKPVTVGAFSGDGTVYATTNDLDASSIALADLTGDGRLDIIAGLTQGGGTQPFADNLEIYLNQGDGTFAKVGPGLNLPDPPTDVVTADFDGDGHADILTAGTYNFHTGAPDYSTLTLSLGNGDGTFQKTILIDGGAESTRVAVGDFNHDGHEDIVTNGGPAGTLKVLLGKGDGSFTVAPTATLPSSIRPTDLVAADVNGDGIPDILATDETNGQLDVLLGNGDGTFRAGTAIAVGSPEKVFNNYGTPTTAVDETDSIAVGDLNGDGIADIVTIDATDRTVVVLLGHGDGTFTRGAGFTFPADISGLVASSTGLGTPDQFDELYDGDSFLQAFNPATVTIADMNNDGIPDLVVGSGQYGNLVLLGHGDGSYTPGPELKTTRSDDYVYSVGPTATAVGDLNQDGRADIVTSGESFTQNNADASSAGIEVLLNEAPTILPATSAPVTIARSALANPYFEQTGGGGTPTREGASLSVDLGTIAQGQGMQALTFALQNLGEEAVDAFTGLFTDPAVAGYTVTGAALPGPVMQGQSYNGLSVAIDTTTLGQHTQTITFAPRDQSATTTTYATTPGTDDVTATTTSVDGANVAAELAPITLTITDTVAPSTTGVAVLQAPGAVTLPNVRVGATDQQAIAIANAAAAPAAVLDVGATATGAATVTGSVVNLAAGGTDTSDLVAGLSTAQAGTASGTIALAPASDSGSGPVALTPTSVAISGKVFRTAVAQVAPVSVVLNMNAPGLLSLSVRNAAANDGYSEALVAALGSVGSGLTAAGAASTGDVAAGAVSTALAVQVDTSHAGTFSTTATLTLLSDGGTGAGAIDGLGTLGLASIVVPISVTVLAPVVAPAVLQAPAALSFGNVRVGASDSQAIAITNAATVPAAVLDVTAAASGAASVTGSIANLAAGATDTADLVAGLSTAQAGAVSGSLTLAPGSDSGGGAVPLSTATVALSGKVYRTAVAQIAPIALTLNVGDPGLVALNVRNTAANDGYSEALVASIGSLGSGLTAAGVASTGDVAAGAASTALAVQIDTSHAGTFNTTATLTLLSDGGIGAGAIDGLGTLGLASIVVPISVTVLAPVVAPAVLQAPAALSFGNVRVGASDSQAIAITNAATVPAAVLDVTAAASGAASVTGSIANLAAGATDTADLVAGLSTAQAGAVSGSLTLAPGSDNGGGAVPLSTATVALSGKVYRTAAAQVLPVSIVVHVGDIGIAPFIIGNAAIADGYSEALAASIGSYGSGLTAAATGGSSTGDIAPGASSSVLSVGFDTSAAGKFTTTATLIDVSDGGTGPGAIDGLGTVALAPIVVPLSVEVDNDAVAAIAVTVGSVTQVANSTKTLNLGSFAQGSGPVSISLGALNQILGQADTLAGMLTSTGGLSGTLSSVSGIAAGALAAAGTLTLDTSSAGTVSDTLTFTPTSVDAAGSTALAPITLTLQATVTPITVVTPPPTGIQPFAALQIAGGGQGVTVQAGLLQPVAGSFTNLLGGTIESDGETYEDEAAATQDQAALAGVTLLASGTPSLGLAAKISGPGVLTDTGSAFSVLTTLSPDATVVAGPGNDRLVSEAGGTLIGGPNGDVFFALAGPTSVQGGPGHDIIASFGGDTTVVTGTGGSIVAFGTGTGTFTGHAADTIFGGSGPDSIVTAANSLVGLRTGAASVSAGSGSIVIGGSGADTVSAAGTGVQFFAGGGAATFIGDSSSSTVVGGAGSDTVDAGAGGGLFGAGQGGNSVLMGGTGASTLFGGASGDVLVAQGAAGTMLAAGAGNETLQGAGSSGNDVFFTGPGADQVMLGSGADYVLLGTGHASVTGGSGPDVLAVRKGSGTAVTVFGWKQGVDALALEQYAPGEGVVSSSVTEGATTVVLSDGATISFAGFSTVPTHLFG